MNHPIIASRNGNERYRQMIRDAENYRRAKAIRGGESKAAIFSKLKELFTHQAPRKLGKPADSPAAQA